MVAARGAEGRRAALTYLRRLRVFIAAAVVAAVLLHGVASGPGVVVHAGPVRVPFDPSFVLWMELAVAAAIGMAWNRHRFVAHQGFEQGRFNPDSAAFHTSLLVQAPFIVLALFAVWDLVVAGVATAFEGSYGGIRPVSLTWGLAGVFGYFSDALIQALRDRVFRLVRLAGPFRDGSRSSIGGADLPLLAVVAYDEVVKAVGSTDDELGRLIVALSQEGIVYTHDLVSARPAVRRLHRVAAVAGVPTTVVERLADVADVSRIAITPELAARLVQRGKRTASDAIAEIERITGTKGGDALQGPPPPGALVAAMALPALGKRRERRRG